MIDKAKLSRRRYWLSACWLALIPVAASCQPPVAAPATWSIEGHLVGKVKKSGESQPAEDISGLACAPETSGRRICLIADDESQSAQIVILREGRLTAGDLIPLISDTHDGKPVELDAEAVAYADGAFYMIGSHGRARHEVDSDEEAKNEAKARASRRVFRIRLAPASVDANGHLMAGAKPEVSRSEALAGLFLAQPTLKSALDQPLDSNGLTVEGLAVANGAMTIGFRGPVAGDEALLLTVPLAAVFDNQAAPGQLRRVKLGRDTVGGVRGVRDLAALDGGFIGIAGPVQDPPKTRAISRGDYAVFFWRPGAPARCQPLDLYQRTPSENAAASDKDKPLKPEGLTLLAPDASGARALLTFDGPGVHPTPVHLTPATAPACAS